MARMSYDPMSEFRCEFCCKLRIEKDRVLFQQFCIYCLEG